MSLSHDSVIKAVHDKDIRLLSAEYVDFGGISRTMVKNKTIHNCSCTESE